MKTAGSFTKARASSTRRCWPPLSSAICRFSNARTPTRSIAAVMVARDTRRRGCRRSLGFAPVMSIKRSANGAKSS